MRIFRSYYKGELSLSLLLKRKNIRQTMELIDKIDNKNVIHKNIKRYIISQNNLACMVAEVIYDVKRNKKLISDINLEYADKIKKYPAKELSWKEWSRLRYCFTWNGMLYLGHLCREKAEEQISQIRGRYGVLVKFSNEMEHGHFNELERMLESSSFHKLYIGDRKSFEECKECYDTITGKRKIEDNFGDYICNKRVVIMGPGKHSNCFEEYNREHDRVVRFTYRGKEFLGDYDKEIPVDIAYYNGEALRYVLNCNDKKFLNDIQFMVIKGKFKHVVIKEVTCSIRNADMFFSGVTFGQTNMVPNVIFDCMHYKCDSIYVRNCNLFLAKVDHEAGYDLREKRVADRWHEFAAHDFEGQFNLMKSFYKYGIFDCDEECRSVLERTNEEYVKAMEEVYSNG